MKHRRGTPLLLTINAGSSSVRCAIYEAGDMPHLLVRTKMERLGGAGTKAVVEDAVRWVEAQAASSSIRAVGHRLVHGMNHTEPQRIRPSLLAELHRMKMYDPDHLPNQIALIEAFQRRRPEWMQVACFDTAFHRSMPAVAKLLPIPRRYAAKGVVRYGFHGLSYSYLMEELRRLDRHAIKGRVILAHLGNGASLAAVSGGKSVDTSMSFTPTAGLMMGTRSGDLDPGLISYLAHTEHMTAAQFHNMVNSKAGLLGVSGTSADIRDLLARQKRDPRAAEAVDMFCYQGKKWIGSFAAALGGIDTLVFAGGIGENAPAIRKKICNGLGFLGIELDVRRNAKNTPLISPDNAHVKVRIIHTDEELMIARSVSRILNIQIPRHITR